MHWIGEWFVRHRSRLNLPLVSRRKIVLRDDGHGYITVEDVPVAAQGWEFASEQRKDVMSKMRALVLERQHELALRDIDRPQEARAGEVKNQDPYSRRLRIGRAYYYRTRRIGPILS